TPRPHRRIAARTGGRVNALPLVLTVFVACAVEAVEALTIVLAAGLTREWRSTFQGMGAALIVLAAVVAVIGPALTLIPLAPLRPWSWWPSSAWWCTRRCHGSRRTR